MGQIIKPKVPLIDYSHPIAKGIVFEDQFFEGAGVNTIDDILTNPLGSVIASGATWDRHLYGVDLDFSAAASAVTYTTPSALNSMKTITVEFLALIRTSGGGANGRLSDKNNNSTVSYWKVYDDGTNMIFQQDWTTNKFAFVAFAPDSKWHHWVFTCTDLTSTAANTMNIYKDGIKQTVSTQNGATTAPTDGSNYFIGNSQAATRNLDGKISYNRIWNRVLSPQEVKQLYMNPWRLDKNRKNTIQQFYY